MKRWKNSKTKINASLINIVNSTTLKLKVSKDLLVKKIFFILK